MKPLMFLAVYSILRDAALIYMDLTGKDTITRADLQTESPYVLLKRQGIDMAQGAERKAQSESAPGPVDPPAPVPRRVG